MKRKDGLQYKIAGALLILQIQSYAEYNMDTIYRIFLLILSKVKCLFLMLLVLVHLLLLRLFSKFTFLLSIFLQSMVRLLFLDVNQ